MPSPRWQTAHERPSLDRRLRPPRPPLRRWVALMTLPRKPKEGLVRFWCRYCKAAICDATPNSQAWCPKGHKCSTTKPKGVK